MRPCLILEGEEPAIGVDRPTEIGKKAGAVVVPSEFVFAAELQSDRLTDFLRQDGGRLRDVAVAAAAVGVRAGVILHADLLDRKAEQARHAIPRLIDAL